VSDETKEALRKELIEDPEARHHYAEMLLDSTVALQIKALRQQREWTQAGLANSCGMKQSRISSMERVDYSSWSVSTLKRLARAFDVRLRVTFESFGSLLDDYGQLGRKALVRPSFKDDPAFKDREHGEYSAGDIVVDLSKWKAERQIPTQDADSSVAAGAMG
jgi:transcriptional regulator with XRE-family HTH domain